MPADGKQRGSLRRIAKRWWDGEYIPFENPPGSPVIIVSGWDKRHWTARVARTIWFYFVTHQKWLIPMIVAAAIALYIGAGQ